MTDIIRSVHLNVEPIRVIELERFLWSFVGEFQIQFRQPGAHCAGIEIGKPEVKVIEGCGLAFALNYAEE